MSIGWYIYFILLIISALLSSYAYYKANKKFICFCFIIVAIWIVLWLIKDPRMLFWPFQDVFRNNLNG